jgi:hypothetical protein
MAITATPPTTLPTMVPVFELLLPEDDGPGDLLGEDECEEVTVGETVISPAAEEVTEPEVPINAPGPISGRSKRGTVKATNERTKRIPTTSSHRFDGAPVILKLCVPLVRVGNAR